MLRARGIATFGARFHLLSVLSDSGNRFKQSCKIVGTPLAKTRHVLSGALVNFLQLGKGFVNRVLLGLNNKLVVREGGEARGWKRFFPQVYGVCCVLELKFHTQIYLPFG